MPSVVSIQHGWRSSIEKRSFGSADQLAPFRMRLFGSHFSRDLFNGSSLRSRLEFQTSERFDFSSLVSPDLHTQVRIDLRPPPVGLQRQDNRHLPVWPGKTHLTYFCHLKVNYVRNLSITVLMCLHRNFYLETQLLRLGYTVIVIFLTPTINFDLKII